MTSEVWTAEPAKGFFKLVYVPGKSNYPVVETHTLEMPEGYDPRAPEHDPLGRGFPTVTPLLQGYDMNFGRDDGTRQEHPIRQLRIDVLSDGWYTEEGGSGIVKQGPNVKIIVGARDNSGGDPPDDPFIVWIHVSALVVY